MKHALIILSISATLLALSCGGKHKPKDNEPPTSGASAGSPTEFPLVSPPVAISDQGELIDYMIEHYWDNFDFADLSYVDSKAMNDGLAYFAVLLNDAADERVIRKGIDNMLRKALPERDMFYNIYDGMDYFLSYPNSELRNNELHIVFLETLLGLEGLEGEERIAPEEDLRLAKLNRVGNKANDFHYTDESGRERRMYNIRADYLLVYFYNLGCEMCREVTLHLKELLTQNPMMSELLSSGRLKVLMIYPPIDKSEDALADWTAHKSEVPDLKGFTNSYDKRAALYDGESYDLGALPSLYLLDRDKKVMLKDFVNPIEMAYAIEARESK